MTDDAELTRCAPRLLNALRDAYNRGYFDPHGDDSECEADEKRAAIDLIRSLTHG